MPLFCLSSSTELCSLWPRTLSGSGGQKWNLQGQFFFVTSGCWVKFWTGHPCYCLSRAGIATVSDFDHVTGSMNVFCTRHILPFSLRDEFWELDGRWAVQSKALGYPSSALFKLSCTFISAPEVMHWLCGASSLSVWPLTCPGWIWALVFTPSPLWSLCLDQLQWSLVSPTLLFSCFLIWYGHFSSFTARPYKPILLLVVSLWWLSQAYHVSFYVHVSRTERLNEHFLYSYIVYTVLHILRNWFTLYSLDDPRHICVSGQQCHSFWGL